MSAPPLRLRIIDPPPWLPDAVQQRGKPMGWLTHREYEPGDAWYATRGDDGRWFAFRDGPVTDLGPHPVTGRPRIADHRHPLVLASEYEHHPHPVMVVLPNRWLHCLHAPSSSSSTGRGWKVTGPLSHVTVTPSINATVHGVPGAGWHGWLRDGWFRSV